MNQNKWYNSNWTIGIVCSSILPIFISLIIDFIKKIPILTTLLYMFSATFEFISAIANYKISVGIILLSIFIIISFLFAYTFINSKLTDKFPSYISYTSDKIKGWVWTWNWEINTTSGRYTINELKAYCPQCNTNLIYSPSIRHDPKFECPRCEYEMYVEYNFMHKIENIIIDNINRNKNRKP